MSCIHGHDAFYELFLQQEALGFIALKLQHHICLVSSFEQLSVPMQQIALRQ